MGWPAGVETLDWASLDPVAWAGTTYDVVTGSLLDLRRDGGFDGATCAAPGVGAPPVLFPAPDPSPGDGVYYLLRGRNTCGAGTYGRGSDPSGPRSALDADSPCHRGGDGTVR